MSNKKDIASQLPDDYIMAVACNIILNSGG